jgi:hypothetical protein
MTNRFNKNSFIVSSSYSDNRALQALDDPNALQSALARIGGIFNRENIRSCKEDTFALSVAKEALG